MKRAPSAMTPAIGVVVQLVAALAVTAALLAAIEYLAGVVLGRQEAGQRRSPTTEVGGDAVATYLRYMHRHGSPLAPDLDLLWRNEPTAEKVEPINPRVLGRDEHWTIRINAHGHREAPRADYDDPRRAYRILSIGDSVTFGYCVDQDAPFPHQLERFLTRRYPRRTFEVINAGVPGWTWVQGSEYLEREGLRLHPALVIMALGTNDRFWQARVTDWEHIWLLKNPVVRLAQWANDLALGTNTYRMVLSLMPPPSRPATTSPGCDAQIRATRSCRRVALEEIEARVHRAWESTRAAGVDLLVVNLDFFETGSAAAVKRAIEKDHIPFVDYVALLTQRRLADDIRRAQSLGLAPPRVPLVPLGMATQADAHPRTIVLRVLDDSAPAAMTVAGAGYPVGDFAFDQALYDDGTHGDEVGGDRVYSALVEVPREIAAIRYKFFRDGLPEFEALPPLSVDSGDRLVRFNRDAVAPIDLFAERFLMAESVHPNAEGQYEIAAALVGHVERSPSFQTFVTRAGSKR